MNDDPSVEWVFGYGSLMWNPGFPYIARASALLRGFHRAFCITSHHYRGTPDSPGLVLGLDQGGECRGIAFQVATADWDNTLAYLNERELIGYAYQPATVEITTDQATVPAYTFIADRDHAHYAGAMDLEPAAARIMSAAGVNGLNRDYLINTVHQLETHGFPDPALHALLRRVEELTGIIDQGGGI